MGEQKKKKVYDIPLDLLYPRQCPFCQRIAGYGRLICSDCEKEVPYLEEPFCMKCGKPFSIEEEAKEYCRDCQLHKRSFIRNYGLLRYESKVKKSIYAFKYANKREYADWYAKELVKRYGALWKNFQIDGIIPVPVHKKKRKQRGYNQAEILGRKLGELLEIPCISKGLVRTVDTTPQKELDHKQRYKNLKSAFSIGHIPEEVHIVLLVDDIYTTGATMEACSSLLLEQTTIEKVYACSISVGNGL